MGNTQRVFNSEITIDTSNRWFFRGQEIIHTFVLDFFRENLFEDEKGIYILNSYGQFSEKGYLECNGFPVFMISAVNQENSILFRSNNSNAYSLDELNFFFDEKERLFCIHKDHKFLKFGFSKPVLYFLSEYLKEEDDMYYLELNGTKRIVNKFQDQFEIMVPIIL